MADDETPRQPPQAYDTVSPAGVGATTTNQVSPGAMQDLYFTGDQGLIDVAMEEMRPDALSAFLAQLPSPNTRSGLAQFGGHGPARGSSPAGVGSQASHTPSTVSVRTPTPSPSPTTQRRQLTQRTLARIAAGAGGDGDDDGQWRQSTQYAPWTTRPRARPRARSSRTTTEEDPYDTPGYLGHLPPNPATPRGSWSPGSQPRTLGQADLQRRLRMMLQDQEQLAQGREIANVTMTNSIVTSYKQGGAPACKLFVPDFAVMTPKTSCRY